METFVKVQTDPIPRGNPRSVLGTPSFVLEADFYDAIVPELLEGNFPTVVPETPEEAARLPNEGLLILLFK